MDFYLKKREKIISRKRRMAEEVKPIYKRFTDRYIKYYVSKQYTLIAIYAYPRVFMMRRMISLISES